MAQPLEALIIHRNITKTFALQTNVTSSKSSVFVVLVLVLVKLYVSSSTLFICLVLVLSCFYLYL